MYIVRIIGSLGDAYYGPFATKEEAERFAEPHGEQAKVCYLNEK